MLRVLAGKAQKVPPERGALERTAGRLVNQPPDIPSSGLLLEASALQAGARGSQPRRKDFQKTLPGSTPEDERGGPRHPPLGTHSLHMGFPSGSKVQ